MSNSTHGARVPKIADGNWIVGLKMNSMSWGKRWAGLSVGAIEFVMTNETHRAGKYEVGGEEGSGRGKKEFIAFLIP